MHKYLQSFILAMLVFSTSAYAHHPAADIVDEEIYARIDELLSDTPHATLTFDEMGGGMTETTITADSLREFENMVTNDDLLEYIELLDGVVNVFLSFNDDGSVSMTVSQVR